jgi:hypothetical protein
MTCHAASFFIRGLSPSDIHYDGQVLKVTGQAEQRSIYEKRGLVLVCPITAMNVAEDMKPRLQPHYGKSKFSTTLPYM